MTWRPELDGSMTDTNADGLAARLRGLGPGGVLVIAAILMIGNWGPIPAGGLLVLLWAGLSETPLRALYTSTMRWYGSCRKRSGRTFAKIGATARSSISTGCRRPSSTPVSTLSLGFSGASQEHSARTSSIPTTRFWLSGRNRVGSERARRKRLPARPCDFAGAGAGDAAPRKTLARIGAG